MSLSKSELALYRMKKEVRESVEEKMTALIDSTNIMGSEESVVEGVLEAMLKAHPTLIQSFASAFHKAASKAAEHRKFDGFDPRCAETGKFFQQIKRIEVNFPFI